MPAPSRSSGANLHDRGYCYKDSYEGWYCVHEETYYAESDLEKNEEGQLVCPDCKRPVQRMSSGRGELVLPPVRLPAAAA